MLPCFLFISFISYLIHLFFFPFAPLFSILCSFPNLLNPSFTLPLQCEATVCMFIFCHLSFLLLCSRSALTRLLAFSFRQCTKLGSGHRQSHRTVITDQWNDPHGPVNHTHTHSHTYLCTDTAISGSSGEVWEKCYVRRLTNEVCVKFEETGRKSPSPDSCEPWKTGLRDSVKCLFMCGRRINGARVLIYMSLDLYKHTELYACLGVFFGFFACPVLDQWGH